MLGFIRKISVTYQSKTPIIFTGMDKNRLKTDCIDGFLLDGVRHLILFSITLDYP